MCLYEKNTNIKINKIELQNCEQIDSIEWRRKKNVHMKFQKGRDTQKNNFKRKWKRLID